MKALLTLTALALTMTACQGTTNTTNEAPEVKRITTITCETREGWVDFQTYQAVVDSYGWRNGTWRIRLVSGGVFTASNCHAFEEEK